MVLTAIKYVKDFFWNFQIYYIIPFLTSDIMDVLLVLPHLQVINFNIRKNVENSLKISSILIQILQKIMIKVNQIVVIWKSLHFSQFYANYSNFKRRQHNNYYWGFWFMCVQINMKIMTWWLELGWEIKKKIEFIN